MKVVYVSVPWLPYQESRVTSVARHASRMLIRAGACPVSPILNAGGLRVWSVTEKWQEANETLLLRSDCALFADEWWCSSETAREMVRCLMEGIPCMVLPPASDESTFVAEDTIIELLQHDKQKRRCRADAIEITRKASIACYAGNADSAKDYERKLDSWLSCA